VSVPLDAANQTDVGVGINENFHVAQIASALVHEQKDSIDDHNVGRLDAGRPIATEMSDEIVFGLVDRLPPAEILEMAAEQIVVECVGVIPVDLFPFGKRQLREILVVRVHVDEGDRRSRQQLRHVSRNGRLSGARPAGDPDD